ncbi:GNAT family N-acetyltransferase [Loktanella sp. S4079]|uniref:GNAT family N-acetyltransferase n=1 Tax=Loktanella sp. S4079 TaxID=579483 RepID=UPI0005F9E886|nr:GNAT family N-acetyltransferase [Loktanella sp. S4079]KJZ19596.1 aminoglycoside 6'-acetyltransferase [Loktanella sp. S4079]
MRNYDFRRFTDNDIPLLRQWLHVAHVRAWWPDPDRQIAQFTKHMSDRNFDIRMVNLANRPFAFIFDFDTRASGKAEFSDLPARSRGMGTFVGNPDFLGPGHATGYIEARVHDLRRNHGLVAVGPNTTDTRTISIYRQAGFQPRRLAGTNDGKLVQVMTHL